MRRWGAKRLDIKLMDRNKTVIRQTIGRRLRRFVGDLRGVAAIEFAVVLPMVIVLIFAMIQYGVILNTRQIMAKAARTAVRSYAVGTSTEAEAEQLAVTLMNNAALNFVVDVTDDGTDATILITLAMADAALVDALGKSLMDGDIEVSISMRLEG